MSDRPSKPQDGASMGSRAPQTTACSDPSCAEYDRVLDVGGISPPKVPNKNAIPPRPEDGASCHTLVTTLRDRPSSSLVSLLGLVTTSSIPSSCAGGLRAFPSGCHRVTMRRGRRAVEQLLRQRGQERSTITCIDTSAVGRPRSSTTGICR